MDETERQIYEVLHNLNWLMEPHGGFVELIGAKGRMVVIRCVGYCATCKTDCVRTAFKERMPGVELIVQ